MQHLLVPVYRMCGFFKQGIGQQSEGIMAQDVVIHIFHYFLTFYRLNDQITEKFIFILIDNEIIVSCSHKFNLTLPRKFIVIL